MATPRGVIRRPNTALGTRSSSMTFTTSDHLWLQEQAKARNITMSLVLADCIELYRNEQEAEIARMEKEEKKALRSKLPDAPSDNDPIEM